MRIVNVVAVSSLFWVPATGQAGEQSPSYTNEDLDRIAPRRGETGATSVPASSFATPDARRDAVVTHGEAYWRQEASRLADRLRPLRRRALALRFKIEHPATRPGKPAAKRGAHSRTATADPVPGLQEQLREVEQEIREREDSLEDRARREGAMPGWLR
jgi:hypothetical protein